MGCGVEAGKWVVVVVLFFFFLSIDFYFPLIFFYSCSCLLVEQLSPFSRRAKGVSLLIEYRL